MSEEKLLDITPPKIDIELCTTDNNIPPIDKVYVMDEDSYGESRRRNSCKMSTGLTT